MIKDKMNNQYIKDLIDKIENTEFWYGNSPQEKMDSYDSGIELLVDIFTRHKESKSQLFFIGNGLSLINI